MITAIGRYKTFKFQKIIQYLNNHKTPLLHEALDHQRLLNLWRFMNHQILESLIAETC